MTRNTGAIESSASCSLFLRRSAPSHGQPMDPNAQYHWRCSSSSQGWASGRSSLVADGHDCQHGDGLVPCPLLSHQPNAAKPVQKQSGIEYLPLHRRNNGSQSEGPRARSSKPTQPPRCPCGPQPNECGQTFHVRERLPPRWRGSVWRPTSKRMGRVRVQVAPASLEYSMCRLSEEDSTCAACRG